MSYDFRIKGPVACKKVREIVEKNKDIKGAFPSYYLLTEHLFMGIDLENLDEEETSIGGVDPLGKAHIVSFTVPYAYWRPDEYNEELSIENYINLALEIAEATGTQLVDRQLDKTITSTNHLIDLLLED